MCGIFGMVGRRDHSGLREAALTLRHRGPDGFGEWSSPDRSAYLAHCRLSIIDLSDAGRQPMANEDGRIQLTFNGEIYNFAELRSELIEAGHCFRSKTDSEVIIHGYEEWGEAVVQRLRGIFAFGLWDENRRSLLLVRDRFGVKPLHYSLHGGELAFASETRALLPSLRNGKAANGDAVLQFLRHGYVLGTHTIWQGIARLPPATILRFDADTGAISIRRYWRVDKPDEQGAGSNSIDALDDLLESAVGEQLVGDVPVGVFLSGGIDSSLVAAHASRASPHIDSFFVDFVGWAGSERADAQAVATHLGTRHHVSEIERASFGLSDPQRAREFFSAFDEPHGDPAILPTWHLSRRIREHVSVALSGEGGDELFGGYAWYRQVVATPRRRLAWMVERLRRRIGLGREWPYGCANQEEYYHFLHCPTFSQSELAMLFPQWAERIARLLPGIKAEGVEDSASGGQKQWQELDLQTFLVDNNLARVDRASMAHGLEVRVPLLDHRIAELAMGLPASALSASGAGKPMLRALAARFLPASIQAKAKQGFSFPMRQLIEEPDLVATLRQGALVSSGMLDADGLDLWLHSLRSGGRGYQLWLLFVLEWWARVWLLDEVRPAP